MDEDGTNSLLDRMEGESVAEVPLNPYDFRRPITERGRLIGRDSELEEIDECVIATTRGEPVHLAVIGERAAGKTSLLNVAATTAEDRGLLVVRVDLDEAVVETPLRFFRAVFEAAVGSLVDANVLPSTDPRYVGWVRQVYQGDTDLPPDQQLLLFGQLAAGELRGTSPTDVSPYLVAHDFARIAAVTHEGGRKGVVLLIDEGDLLGRESTIFQKLRNVLQGDSSWMLVAAGTEYMFSEMSDVFSPIPRQFKRLSVTGLEFEVQVSKCMRAPLDRLEIKNVVIPFQVVEDVHAITHGRPYEINLVSYSIWKEVYDPTAKKIQFTLTQSVLDNVLEELLRVGPHTVAAEVDRIRQLSREEFEDLAELVPNQQMTVRQAALASLLLRNFEPADLDLEIQRLTGHLEHLQELGVIRREGDRFHLEGDDFVQVYVKYALARHGRAHSHAPGYGTRTYAQALTDKVLSTAYTEVVGLTEGVNTIRIAMARELGQLLPTTSLGSGFRTSVLAHDIPGVAGGPGLAFRLSLGRSGIVGTEGADLRAADYVAIGVRFQIGIEVVDVLDLIEATPGSAIKVEEGLRAWAYENASLMEQFEATIQEIVATDLPAAMVRELTDYSEAVTGWYLDALFKAFHDNHYSEAAQIALSAVAAMEPYLAQYVGGKQYRRDLNQLGDALNRAGFLLLLAGETGRAAALLSKALHVSEDEKGIKLFNLGRCHLELSDWTAARSCFQTSWEILSEGHREEIFLMSAIDLPPELRHSEALLATVRPDWASDFALAHEWIARIRLSQATVTLMHESFDEAFHGAQLPTVIVRMLAWEYYAIDQVDTALDLLKNAAQADTGNPHLPLELAFLERATSGDPE